MDAAVDNISGKGHGGAKGCAGSTVARDSDKARRKRRHTHNNFWYAVPILPRLLNPRHVRMLFLGNGCGRRAAHVSMIKSCLTSLHARMSGSWKHGACTQIYCENSHTPTIQMWAGCMHAMGWAACTAHQTSHASSPGYLHEGTVFVQSLIAACAMPNQEQRGDGGAAGGRGALW